MSFLSLPLVDTISPLSRKISVTLTACVSKPPGLDRTSKIYPLIFKSELLAIATLTGTLIQFIVQIFELYKINLFQLVK